MMESQRGDHEKAKKILERGLQCVSDRRERAIILSTLGGLYARQRDFARARQYFIEAIGLHEANPLSHYHFAVDCLIPEGNQKEPASICVAPCNSASTKNVTDGESSRL
jgi:uncharacterized protein HemY